jgi:hypothetical protein
MKPKKMIGICLFFFFLLVHFSGCVWFTYHYEFSQEADNIASIDICRYTYDEVNPEMTIICSLDESLKQQFISDIVALDSYKYFGDFSRIFDGVLVYITYENGEGEVLSANTTAKVDLSGQWNVGVDNFDKIEFYSVILKYVDPDLVPELEQYIEPHTNKQ